MFVSLIAEIEVERAVSIPVTHGEAMQAEMLRHISRLNPAAAAELHGPAGGTMRPYTVSLLRPGRGGINNGRLHYESGDHAWFRLTGMGPLPYAALSAVSENVDSWRLDTFHAEFRILRWCASPQDHSWAGIADLDELLNSAEQALLSEPHRAVLVFHSPTTFELDEKRWGNWMPLPIPNLVFGNLRKHAASFISMEALEPDNFEEIIVRHIAPGQFTDITSHGRERRSGFTGRCEFLFDRELSDRTLVWLHLLANAAFYTGIGRATTQGKGQVKRETFGKFSYRGGGLC